MAASMEDTDTEDNLHEEVVLYTIRERRLLRAINTMKEVNLKGNVEISTNISVHTTGSGQDTSIVGSTKSTNLERVEMLVRFVDLQLELQHYVQPGFVITEAALDGFLNKASDLVMPTMQEYVNGGKNHTVGVELSADYQRPRFTANMNLTWTHNLRSNVTGSTFDNEENEKFKPSNIDTNNNTPAIVSNTVLAWQATPHLKLHGHLLVESKQTSYNFDMMKYQYLVQEIIVIHDYTDEELKAMYDAVIAKYDIPARAIVNVGADYKIGKLTLGLNIHNLFDTRYDRSYKF